MKAYPKYKPSNIEWIGEIPEHWGIKKLKYLSTKNVQYGLNIGSEFYINDGIRFLRTTDIDNKGNLSEEGVFLSEKEVESNYILNIGDFLISRSGTIGRAYVHQKNDIKYSYAGYLVRFCFNNIYISKFIYYITKTTLFFNWLNMNSIEATIGNVNGQKYANFSIQLPPNNELNHIVTYLDDRTQKIDALIEKKQKLIDLLKEERTANINQAVTKGLNPDVPMKDSGIEWLGEVPKHWEVTKLKYLTTKIGSGVTPKGGSETYLKEGIPFIRSQNVHFEGLIFDDIAYISEEVHKEMRGSKVYPNDVLLNITGASIGRCYFVPSELKEANVNQHVCIIRSNNKIITKYLFSYLSSEKGQAQIFLSEKGISREGLTFEQIGNFIITLPLIEEQELTVQFTESESAKIDHTISRIEKEIELMKEYHTALISEVVTGKIDVREGI